MAGGELSVFKRYKSVLQAMEKNATHVSPGGMGQTVKLMNQILMVGNLNAVTQDPGIRAESRRRD